MIEGFTIGSFVIIFLRVLLKNKRLKVLVAVAITLIVFFILDLLTGLSYSQFYSTNIALIKSYNEVKKDSQNDSIIVKLMDAKILEVSQRQHYSPLLSRFFLKVKSSFNQPTKNVPQTQKADIKKIYLNTYSINSNVELFSYKFISSAWLMIILVVFLNLFFIATYKNIFVAVFSSIILSFTLLSISISIAKLCNMIPIIQSIYVNYTFNFFIGILFPVLIIYSTGKLASQYESYLEDNGMIMPDVNAYDSFFAYYKAILKASRFN